MEVCHINIWGRVCGDSHWGLADAHVTCKQLGLPNTGATTHTVTAVSSGSRVIWLRNVRCSGTEGSLFNCSYDLTGNDNCYQSVAGVSCQDSKSNYYFFMYVYT